MNDGSNSFEIMGALALNPITGERNSNERDHDIEVRSPPIQTCRCLVSIEQRKLGLGQDDDSSDHSQLIVQHAYIRINSGSGEGHAEAGGAQWCLCQTSTILR